MPRQFRTVRKNPINEDAAALKFSHPALSNYPTLGNLGKSKLFELMLEDDAGMMFSTKAKTFSLSSRTALLNLPRKARVKRSEPSFSELQWFSYVHTKNVSKRDYCKKYANISNRF